MKAYVIKRGDGKYWLGGFYGLYYNVGNIAEAKIYQTKSKAQSIISKIKKIYDVDNSVCMTIVPVEIKECNE